LLFNFRQTKDSNRSLFSTKKFEHALNSNTANIKAFTSIEGPMITLSMVPTSAQPECKFCDLNSPGGHYFQKVNKPGLSQDQVQKYCENARKLNKTSKEWNINIDTVVNINYWVDVMQTFYQSPPGLYENDTPEERLYKIYQFIIYYRENIIVLKNTLKDDITKLSRVYMNPELVRAFTCQDRMDLIRILCSEGPHQLKGSATVSYKKSEDIILDLFQDVGVDKKCFLEKLIADKKTFCILMQGFIDNGPISYIFGDGNHLRFMEALLKLYFEVISTYSQSDLRALVKTNQIVQVGFSPFVPSSSHCSAIDLTANFNCNGNSVSGTNIIALAATKLKTPDISTSVTDENDHRAVKVLDETKCVPNVSAFSFNAFDLVVVYNYGGNYPLLNGLPKNIPIPAFVLPYLAQVNANHDAGNVIQLITISIGAASTVGAVAAAI
jgi:hypothetical protein